MDGVVFDVGCCLEAGLVWCGVATTGFRTVWGNLIFGVVFEVVWGKITTSGSLDDVLGDGCHFGIVFDWIVSGRVTVVGFGAIIIIFGVVSKDVLGKATTSGSLDIGCCFEFVFVSGRVTIVGFWAVGGRVTIVGFRAVGGGLIFGRGFEDGLGKITPSGSLKVLLDLGSSLEWVLVGFILG